MFQLWSRPVTPVMKAKRRGLVVDPDQPSRKSAMRALALMDVTAIGVGSAEEALIWLETSKRPDLITIESQLPKLSGLELWRIIRRRWVGMPVLFLEGPVGTGVYLEAARRVLNESKSWPRSLRELADTPGPK